jgi:uncharacterized protein YggT (Ycf19 family)
MWRPRYSVHRVHLMRDAADPTRYVGAAGRSPARGGDAVSGGSMFSLWYFHLPNFILAALMYTMLGRALLGLMVQPDSQNYIWRAFCRLTDPVVAVITPVTPKATAPVVVWLFGVVWLFWLRVGLLNLFLALGAIPVGS